MWAETGWVTIVKYLGGTEGWSTRKGAVGGALCWIIWLGQQCRKDEKKKVQQWGGIHVWVGWSTRVDKWGGVSTRDSSDKHQRYFKLFCLFTMATTGYLNIWTIFRLFFQISACPYMIFRLFSVPLFGDLNFLFWNLNYWFAT